MFAEIMMLLGAATYNACSTSKKQREGLANYSQWTKEGRYWNFNYNRSMELSKFFEEDWDSGEKKYYPEEYHKFFEKNPYARSLYRVGLTRRQEVKEEIKPLYFYGEFNRFTFDPFKEFHQECDDDFEYFKQTGEGSRPKEIKVD